MKRLLLTILCLILQTCEVIYAQSGYRPPSGGGGAVSSVFTRTGAVTAQSGDYSFSQVGGFDGGAQAASGWKRVGNYITLVDTTDSVGVGTATPTVTLDVEGGMKVSSLSTLAALTVTGGAAQVSITTSNEDGVIAGNNEYSLRIDSPNDQPRISPAAVPSHLHVESGGNADLVLNAWTSTSTVTITDGHTDFSDAITIGTNLIGGSQLRGSNAFTTTATTDTVTVTSAEITDYYWVQLTGTGAPGATDAHRLQITATGFVLHRGAAGTSGLTYNWLRVK